MYNKKNHQKNSGTKPGLNPEDSWPRKWLIRDIRISVRTVENVSFVNYIIENGYSLTTSFISLFASLKFKNENYEFGGHTSPAGSTTNVRENHPGNIENKKQSLLNIKYLFSETKYSQE